MLLLGCSWAQKLIISVYNAIVWNILNLLQCDLLYPLFYEAGFNGMGLFLEMGHILFCAYYDKTLTPASRVLYASASRAIMVCWREKLLKARCVGKHFITSQSYDDFLASVDGLVWYILSCVSNFPKADIVPWYLTSDSLEQLFAWLRTGMHAGRKTNLDAVAVLTGCGKRNLSLTLDADGLHLLEHSVAHTRGRQLFKMAESQDAIIYKGNQTCKEELMEAIKEGEKLGQSKFDKYAGFTEDMYVASDPEDTDVLSEVRGLMPLQTLKTKWRIFQWNSATMIRRS